MNRDAIIRTLRGRIPNLLAIYAFGSRTQGPAQPESDLDLAVLVAGYAEPLTLWTHDVFALLAHGGWIEAALADRLKRMVGFRNIALHDYQSLHLSITIAILKTHLDEFLQYSQALLRRDARQV